MKKQLSIAAILSAAFLTGCNAIPDSYPIDVTNSAFDGREEITVGGGITAPKAYMDGEPLHVLLPTATIYDKSYVHLKVARGLYENMFKMRVKANGDIHTFDRVGTTQRGKFPSEQTFMMSCDVAKKLAADKQAIARITFSSGYSDFTSSPNSIVFFEQIAGLCE